MFARLAGNGCAFKRFIVCALTVFRTCWFYERWSSFGIVPHCFPCCLSCVWVQNCFYSAKKYSEIKGKDTVYIEDNKKQKIELLEIQAENQDDHSYYLKVTSESKW